MILAADTDIWRYQPHPEVWLVVAGAVFLGWYAVKVIGPHAVPPGRPVVTRRNTVAYVLAIAVLWFASDWPMHDISEEYLYSVHMVQHLLISMVLPPLLLTATPEWLARLIVNDTGALGTWTRRMTHPVVAGGLFNLVVIATHLAPVVNFSVENGPFHYLVHLVVLVTAIWMWTPIVGPIAEVRLSPQAQTPYLFLMSVIPTVPAGFLTFAEGTLYDAYDHPVRLWGVSVTTDQQTAGLIMKIVGGLYLWGWILVRFVQAQRADRSNEAPIVVTTTDQTRAGDTAVSDTADSDTAMGDTVDLTFAQVTEAFERSGPAPAEGGVNGG